MFREHRFIRERHYLVRLPDDRIDTARLAGTEDNPVLEVRWWSVAELLASTDWIEPRGFPELARRVAAGEVPASPVVLT